MFLRKIVFFAVLVEKYVFAVLAEKFVFAGLTGK